MALTSSDIIRYLVDLGYTVDTTPVRYENNWQCDTTKGENRYHTTVITDSNNDIITHEDILI
jgi:hypothetical protein